MSLQDLEEDDRYFRQLTPQELAKDLREYLENMSIEYVPSQIFAHLNILRAAKLLEGIK